MESQKHLQNETPTHGEISNSFFYSQDVAKCRNPALQAGIRSWIEYWTSPNSKQENSQGQLNYGHLKINTCIVGESMSKVKVASLVFLNFTTYCIIYNWMSVCNTSGEHSCTIFRLMHAVGTNKHQQYTELCWGLKTFLTVMMCALRKKKCCGAEDKQEAADNHFTPPVVLGCAAGVVIFPPDAVSSIGSWQKFPPQRKISPFALQLSFVAKTYRIPALSICLLQLQFLFWGLQWGRSHSWHKGVPCLQVRC